VRSLKNNETVYQKFQLFGKKTLFAPNILGRNLRWSLSGMFIILIVSFIIKTNDYEDQFLSELSKYQVSVSGAVGLVVDEVLVNGRQNTTKTSLLEALNVKLGEPILGVDLDVIQSRIMALPWVKTAQIQRQLPDKILINLEERRPSGRWQRNGRLTLIDEDGVTIRKLSDDLFQHLPIIIGKDAPAKIKQVLPILKKEPELFRRIKALTFVGSRRWNIRVDDKIDIKLPEKQIDKAWSHLATIEKGHKVLNDDVIAVDMRIIDQFIIKLTPAKASVIRKPGRTT
jgi:cell division protein FtsQ|tara:strand:- start:3392 stop:4246 length:855 start_codon:yes stop_codon:yes gene_type:complete